MKSDFGDTRPEPPRDYKTIDDLFALAKHYADLKGK